MSELLQNTLAEATTEMGFPEKTGLPLQREVTLETGETVTVESVVPEKMAETLHSTFKTPGEKYVYGNYELDGVVQNYNKNSGGPQILEKGKHYILQFKSEDMNVDTLNSFNEHDITKAKSISEFVHGNEICRLGIALDNDLQYATISVNWTEYADECDAYVYDEMYEAIKDKIDPLEEDESTDGYEGPGWYHFYVNSGDISDVTTITVGIEKINTPDEMYVTIGEYYYFFGEEIADTVDMTGIFSICEEIDSEADVVISLDNPQSTSGGQLAISSSYYNQDYVEYIVNGLFEDSVGKDDVAVELRQDTFSLIGKTKVDSEYENHLDIVNESDEVLYFIESFSSDSIQLNALNGIEGLNLDDHPVD